MPPMTDPTAFEHISYDVADHVATITLDRPENLITFLNGRHKSLPLGGPKTLIVTPTAIRSGV